METLKLAARPAVLVILWILASAHTISQLSTVESALRAAPFASTAAPRSRPLDEAAAFSQPPVPGRRVADRGGSR
jgi:hypothetical protein